MRAAFPGAQAAFINAGSLRLNQNIPKGPILRRDVAELLQFDNQLALVPIRGSTLREVAANAVSGWPGNGRWLQISGFAFEHDQSDRRAPEIGRLELVEAGDRRRPLKDDEVVQVVTTDYLLGARGDRGDRDDYDMLPKWADVAPGQARRSLREVVTEALGPERKAVDPPEPAAARRIVQANAGPPCIPGK
jgi:2',3'-cyclic-nucleotide 2'-phosphodiesterase (5'-nucleotidase family)